MSEIKKPFENENLSKFYLNGLFKQIKMIDKDYYSFPRNTKKHSIEALEREGLITIDKTAPKGFQISFPLAELTYSFSMLTKNKKPTLEHISGSNARLFVLISKEELTPDKTLEVSNALFQNYRLKNVIKTLYLLSRDFEVKPEDFSLRKSLKKTIEQSEFVKEQREIIRKQEIKIDRAKNKAVKRKARKKLNERKKDLERIVKGEN